MTLSSATTPGQCGPGSDGNEGVLRIPQNSSITVPSPSDCLVSYPGFSWMGVLPLCRGVVSIFYSSSQLGKRHNCSLLNIYTSALLLYLYQHHKKISIASFRIRTWVANSTSYNNNYYIMIVMVILCIQSHNFK